MLLVATNTAYIVMILNVVIRVAEVKGMTEWVEIYLALG